MCVEYRFRFGSFYGGCFMKKIVLMASLLSVCIAAPVFADFKDFDDSDLAEMGVSKEYCEALERSVVLLDKALEVESSEIAEQLKQEVFLSDKAKLVRIGELVKSKMDIIVTKAAQAIKNDMTVEEREVVVEFLRNLKAASAITSNDLSAMLEGISNYFADNDGFSKVLEKAAKKYCSEDLLKRMVNYRELSAKELIASFREIEQVNLHDVTLNTAKNFICTNSILSIDFNLISSFDSSLFLQQWFCFAGTSIGIATQGFSDGYFQFVWVEEVKKTGIIFSIMNPVCTQLLETLE